MQNSKRQPIYRKTQVSVVADMRFRGIASRHQVRALRGTILESGKQEKRGLKCREHGVVGEGAASLPPHQLGAGADLEGRVGGQIRGSGGRSPPEAGAFSKIHNLNFKVL